MSEGETLAWTVLPRHARRNGVVVFAAALAALALGALAFGQPILGLLGFALVVGSTLDHLLPSRFTLDAKGASARTGPSLTAMEWGAVQRVLVDAREIRLSPLARPSRLLDATRGVALRTTPENRAAVLAFVGRHVPDPKKSDPPERN